MSQLEIDLLEAFPEEFSQDDWHDLVPRFIEQLAGRELDIQDAYQLALKEAMEPGNIAELPQIPAPDYRLIRASAWLAAHQLKSFPLLAYDVAILKARHARDQQRMDNIVGKIDEVIGLSNRLQAIHDELQRRADVDLKSYQDAALKAAREN